jgi:hypothetical protein
MAKRYASALIDEIKYVESPDLPESWLRFMLGLKPNTIVESRPDALQRSATTIRETRPNDVARDQPAIAHCDRIRIQQRSLPSRLNRDRKRWPQ